MNPILPTFRSIRIDNAKELIKFPFSTLVQLKRSYHNKVAIIGSVLNKAQKEFDTYSDKDTIKLRKDLNSVRDSLICIDEALMLRLDSMDLEVTEVGLKLIQR